MKRWHLFSTVSGIPSFGFGTAEQARRHFENLQNRRVINPYEMTTLEEGEDPPEDALVVNLDTGIVLPNRYKR